jgi:hypothetical protein
MLALCRHFGWRRIALLRDLTNQASSDYINSLTQRWREELALEPAVSIGREWAILDEDEIDTVSAEDVVQRRGNCALLVCMEDGAPPHPTPNPRRGRIFCGRVP